MHFERMGRFMWGGMPERADALVHLGEDHAPVHVDLGDGR